MKRSPILYVIATLFIPLFLFAKVDGAENKSIVAAFQKFVKATQVETKKQTVGEFYRKIQGMLDIKYQEAFTDWVTENKDLEMPKPVINISKLKKGVERVEMIFAGKNRAALVITSADGKLTFEIANQKISYRDLMEASPALEKLGYAGKHSGLVPSFETYSKMTIAQRAEYFKRLHNLALGASSVQRNNEGKATTSRTAPLESRWFSLLAGADQANAKSMTPPFGNRCYLPSGFMYVEINGKCEGTKAMYPSLLAPMAKQCATASKELCNPFIFGMENGQPRCHEGTAKNGGDAVCGTPSKTMKDFHDAIDSMTKTSDKLEGKTLMKDGVAVDQTAYNLLKNEILSPMESYIEDVVIHCRTLKAENKNCSDIQAKRADLSKWVQLIKPANARATKAMADTNIEKADSGNLLDDVANSKYTPLLAFGAIGGIAVFMMNKDDDSETPLPECPPGTYREGVGSASTCKHYIHMCSVHIPEVAASLTGHERYLGGCVPDDMPDTRRFPLPILIPPADPDLVK